MSGAQADELCVVGFGDCVLRIAEQYRLPPEVVWEHPANDKLRQARPDPTALARGDKLFIPEPRQKTARGDTDRRHEFVRTVERVKLRLLFDDGSKPLASALCTFDIEGESHSKRTDAKGIVEVAILPTAVVGTVRIALDGREMVYALQIGDLDLHTVPRGALQRLMNLGYFTGKDLSAWISDLPDLLKKFQANQGLPQTGKLDDATAKRLREFHGG